MKDYYEYGPTIQLDRPTVVTGYLSDFTRGAVYRACAVLGLAFHDVDRLVEHDSGMDILRLVVERGEAHYRDVESRNLERALKQQPPGLIALGDGGLLSERNLDRVRADARLVVLDFELGNLLWRVQQAAQKGEKGPWHPLYPATPATVADIRPFYQERRAGFDHADLNIEASSLSVAGACEALMGQLGA